MKRKIGVILSLILVLSIDFCGTALADPNPHSADFDFLMHNVHMYVYCGSSYVNVASTYSNSETFVMSVTGYFYYTDIDGDYSRVYGSYGGQNLSYISFRVSADDCQTPDFAKNNTIIGCAGSTFNNSIYADY